MSNLRFPLQVPGLPELSHADSQDSAHVPHMSHSSQQEVRPQETPKKCPQD